MRDLIESELKTAFPDAEIKIHCDELDGAHVTLYITSARFQGLSLVEQHRLVHEVVKKFMDDGRVHALKIYTKVPAL